MPLWEHSCSRWIMRRFNGCDSHVDSKTDTRIDIQGGVPKHTRLVTNPLCDCIDESLQSLRLILNLGCIVFNGDRFRQSGKGCGAIT